MATDPNLATLFDDVYAAVGVHPHHHHLRALLHQLLGNATAGSMGSNSAGRADPAWACHEAVLGALAQASQQGPAWRPAGALLAPNGTAGGDAGGSGPVSIGVLQLFLATALIAVNGLVSLWLHLGMHTKLAVATVRCIVQLSILGYILVPIFVANRWWLTLLYTIIMLGVAAIEAVSRPSQSYSGMLPQVLLSLGVASSLVISYGLAVVVQVAPWYDPQYLIPMMGMLLGNACSGIAVGLSTVLDELSTGRDKVEMLLSMGATRQEAARDVVQRAVKMAMTPLLNQMSVVGIVSIPGMMTGQILGGSDPATAARYQIVIMFLIGATTALSAVATILMAVLSIIDDHHRLRSERLQPKATAGSGVLVWVRDQAEKGWAGAQSRGARLATRLRLAFGEVSWRTRHRYLFRRGGSASNNGMGTGTPHLYSRIGSGVGSGEEEEGTGGSSLPSRLQEVLVGGSASSSGGQVGEGSISPREPLLMARQRGNQTP